MSGVLIGTQHLEARGGVGVHVLRSAEALRAAGERVEIVAGRVDPAVAGKGIHELPGLEARQVASSVLARLDQLAGSLPQPLSTHMHHLWDVAVVERLRRYGTVAWHVHEFAACPTGEYHFEPGHECHRAHGPGCVPHILLHGCAHTWDLRGMPRRYRRADENVRVMRAASDVVAYSNFVARHVRRNDVANVHVAPLIVPDVPGWTPPPGSNRVLFAGRLSPNKGLGTLLAAVGELSVELDVVGAGWWQPEAERLAAKLGVTDRVTFHGWQGPEAMDGFYRRANLVAVPSLWPEPFGLVGPEAMAHGRPAVGSDTGGIPEWLDHGETGLLVQPGDGGSLAHAIDRLLGDADLCRRMGEEGARRVRERYSPAAHAAAMRPSAPGIGAASAGAL